MGVEVDNTVAFGVADPVAKDGGALRARAGTVEKRGKPRAIEEIISQYQGGMRSIEEIRSDRERLRQAIRPFLGGVSETNSEVGTVPQQTLKEGQVRRR